MDVFFFGFISWLMEESARLGIKKLYFFTREGEFFRSLYDEVQKYSPPGRRIPKAEIAEVSRMSTFLPSLREISIEEFMRIWRQYPAQSMEALFQSLSMEGRGLEQYLGQYGLCPGEVIRHPWDDGRVRKLFKDREFVRCIEAERDSRRELLYRYLGQKGWQRGRKEAIGIVDIGWKGTIQDNLCYLYPDYGITGFYVGLQPFLSPQPANAKKYGYLDGCAFKGSILLTVRPLEMLCASPNGSVTGYVLRGQNVHAVRKKDAGEDAVYDTYARKEQAKIRSRMRRYCSGTKLVQHCVKSGNYSTRYLRSAVPGGCRASDHKKKAHKALYRFTAYPDRRTVKAYFSLRHNEEFGLGTYVDVRAQFRPGILLWAVYSRKGRKRLKEVLKEASWPQGYLVKYWLYPALYPYNHLLASYTGDKIRSSLKGEPPGFPFLYGK